MSMSAMSFSKAGHLRRSLFLSALAINLFVEILIIANNLSIQYFLYAAPLVVQINLLPPLWATLLWIGSFYIVYITREAAREIPNFRRVNHLTNMALIGSFLVIFSNIISGMNGSAHSSLNMPNQLLTSVLLVGYVFSFSGSFLATLSVMAQSSTFLRIFLIYFLSLLIPVEIWSLVHWIIYPFDVVAYLEFGWQGAFIELQMFYITYPLISWLFVAFLFSWIWVPLVRHVANRIRLRKCAGLKEFFAGASGLTALSTKNPLEKSDNHRKLTGQQPFTNRLVPGVALGVSLIVGVFIAYYPYFSQRPGLVGADSLGYYYTLTAIGNKDLFGATQLAAQINLARVPYHLLLYFLRNLTQLPVKAIVELMPAIAIVANALSVFWFVKIGEKNAFVASTAAILSIFSFTTTISMHAGTVANWFAIALGFVMFGLVLKLHETVTSRLFLAVAAVSVSLFLLHYWAGLFFMVVLVLYLSLELWERRRFSAKFAFAGVLLALAILVAVLMSGIVSRLLIPYGISYVFSDNVGPMEMVMSFWTRLLVLIDSWFFGALANPVMIGLALVGIVVCFYKKTGLSRLLISWTVAGSLLSVLVSPIGANMNQWLLWRTLYLIPFQVQAAIGFCFVGSKLEGLTQSDFRPDGEDYRNSGFYSKPAKNQNLSVILYFLSDFVICALLAFSLPAFLSLIFLNHMILTLIIHFKIRRTGFSSILVFLFSLLVALLLFNYTLRSLAPLTVNRFQP